MPAKIRRIAFILATAIALSSAPSAQALQAPDIRTVDLVPGEGSSAARGFTRLNGWDYFVTGGSNRFNATGIWRTNGATTELVADELTIEIEISSFEIGAPRAFAALGNYLYFTADDGASGYEIWRTDGSSVARVVDLCAASACDGAVGVPFTSGSWVYFNGFTSATGAELWRTNGTTTSIVKDTVPGTGGSSFDDFYTHEGILYFNYSNETFGWELGQTNGTSSGTVLHDLAVGSANSAPHGFTSFAGRLFFSADSQLWSLTATEDPAEFFVPNSSGDSYVHSLTVVGSQMFFSATDGVDGRELWVTSGDPTDPSATTQVADIAAGSGDSGPMWLTAFGTRVYFAASDGIDGTELWSSNGRDNASQVADINPGSGNSEPNDLTVFAGALYLYANDGELWRVTDSISANRESMVQLWDDVTDPYDVFFNVGLEVEGDKLYLQTGVPGAGREYAWMQAPAAPRSVVAPTITGTAKVGKVLTGARGSWTGVPLAITSGQWYRCTKSGITTPTTSSLTGCVAISGATKATYKAVTADKGKYLRLRVKAQNESGTVYRWSKATVKILP
jgi:ELWxxDGT repeat protein